MPLEHMGAFVCKYLIYLFIRMAFRMYEYHLEERKGAGGFIQSVNLDTVNNGPLTAVSQQQERPVRTKFTPGAGIDMVSE